MRLKLEQDKDRHKRQCGLEKSVPDRCFMRMVAVQHISRPEHHRKLGQLRRLQRDLGHFPTSHFQPTRRSAGGRKYGSGYPLPMLAMKVFPYSLLQRKAPFCQTYAKEKRCNLKKITTLPKPIQFSFSTSAISFAVAVTIRMPLSLMLSSSVSSCRLCVDFSAVLSGKKNWSTDMS